jgi:hypothetical protein
MDRRQTATARTTKACVALTNKNARIIWMLLAKAQLRARIPGLKVTPYTQQGVPSSSDAK